jgi:hypothetical protein
MRSLHVGLLLVPAAIIAGAVVLFAARGPQAGSAFTLKVGDCFNLPAGATVVNVDLRPCTSPHDGEVFYTADDTTTPVWPGVDEFSNRVAAQCVSGAFEPYLGATYGSRPELKVAYFFPPADAWESGQRRLTCYVSSSDGSKVSTSLRAAP